MKVFQVINNICHWEATRQFPTVADTKGRFPASDIFVEAPDFVFEGWGVDFDADGDNRFVKPTAPEGWLYDEGTGTFYPENDTPPSELTAPKVEKAMALLSLIAFGDEVDEVELDAAAPVIAHMAGVEAEPEGATWAAGRFYREDTGIWGTDGEEYTVNRDHISDATHIPQAPSGGARYRRKGSDPVPKNIIEWKIGSPAKAGEILLYTDGMYYDILKDHTMGWSATPGGWDPEGWYGPGRVTP